jgi:hypothetical protein
MHFFHRGVLLTLGLATMALTLPVRAAEDKIAAQPITYAELGKMLRSHKGKVIVVDFWSVY